MKKTPSFLSLYLLILFAFFSCGNEPYEFDFEDVVIIDEMEEEETACDDAILATNDAALDFSEAISENYTQLCNSYKEALLAEIEACGDENNALQSIIESLDNCISVQASCLNATEIADAFANVLLTVLEENYLETCEAYKIVLAHKISVCGDLDGSTQAIIDELGDCSVD